MFSLLFLVQIPAEESDVIVLVDASGTILPWFEQINGNILTEISRKFLRQGDTFHLISFNSRVNLEIVQPIKTESDVSRIVSRLMLLYPIGQNSDFLSGLQYTVQYAGTLDQQKKTALIIITDGIFNPPENSPYFTYSPEQISNEISSLSRKIRNSGWSVYYIKLPFPDQAEIIPLEHSLSSSGSRNTQSGSNKAVLTTPNASEMQETASKLTGTTTASAERSDTSGNETEIKQYTDISTVVTDSLHIQPDNFPKTDTSTSFVESALLIPEIVFPEYLGKKGRRFTLPLRIINNSESKLYLELIGLQYGSLNLLEENSFISLDSLQKATLKARVQLPPSIPEGENELLVSLLFSGTQRVIPDTGTISLFVVPYSLENILTEGSTIILTVFLLVCGIAIVVLIVLLLLHRTTNPAARALRKVQNDTQGVPANAPTMSRESSDTASEAVTQPKAFLATESKKVISFTEKQKEPVQNPKEILDSTVHTESTKASLNNFFSAFLRKKDAIDFPASSTNLDVLDMYQNNRKAIPVEDILSSHAEKNKADHIAYTVQKNTRNTLFDKTRVSPANSKERIDTLDTAKILVQLHVERQNPNIGKRNTHILKPGSRLGIGGRNSAFLIFLVPVPGNIAEIRWNGKNCTLAILKPNYFPFENENIITDCLNRKFTVVSDKNYQLEFEIRQYEDPVIALNRLLTSIEI
mgnify:FL=1